jgi:hypothetical protein
MKQREAEKKYRLNRDVEGFLLHFKYPVSNKILSTPAMRIPYSIGAIFNSHI